MSSNHQAGHDERSEVRLFAYALGQLEGREKAAAEAAKAAGAKAAAGAMAGGAGVSGAPYHSSAAAGATENEVAE